TPEHAGDVEAEIREFIGADTLGYLSQEGLYWFQKKEDREWFCDACFTGDYPVNLADNPHVMEEAQKFRKKPRGS
ncbi:MAG TPA: hypothetical protein PLT05_04805, partial [bacterium]|nr:hypothetical protein [bacterium]